jgi:protein Tob/BTG
MKTEIQHAVTFLVDTLKEKLPHITVEELRTFRTRLTDLLAERYENHWYVDKPLKGSAFRCINISIEDNSIDIALRSAANESGISEEDIVCVFPNGLALWVDPDDVSGRVGKGAIFPIYKKIVDNRTVVTEPSSSGLQHRPQQRPRSISPPQSVMSSPDIPSSKPVTTSVSRPSKTPPGFRSLDAGQNFYTLPNQNSGRSDFPNNNIQNLWRNHATTGNTTTASNVNTARNPVSYVSSNKYNSGDAVYSFNQYSSYYNPHFHWRKDTQFSGAVPQKSLWQDDESYQRTRWFRESNKNSGSKLSVAGNNLTLNQMQNYAYGISRQAQEVY